MVMCEEWLGVMEVVDPGYSPAKAPVIEVIGMDIIIMKLKDDDNNEDDDQDYDSGTGRSPNAAAEKKPRESRKGENDYYQ